MDGSFSRTAYERLPSAVKRLERDAQTVCIHLRLRRPEERIARDMGLPAEEVARLAGLVRRTLILSGGYDIISDPVFVRIDDVDASRLSSAGAGMEESLLAERFLTALEAALGGLSRGERRLLHLFFERRMEASEIASFLKSSGAMEREGVGAEPREILRGVETALKKLLDAVNEATPIGRGTLTVKGLREVLEQTGVAQ